MENYHLLSREGERLKEYKRSLLQHREVYSLIYFQLQQRRRRLLQELLFIYPIEKHSEEKYTVHGIYLPRSDILAGNKVDRYIFYLLSNFSCHYEHKTTI